MSLVNTVLEAQGMMLFLLRMRNVLASHQERTWYRSSGICGGMLEGGMVLTHLD